MVNGLVDFGGNGGVGAYAGAGIGRAKVKQLGDSDNAWAYQLLAGVYMPISDNVDVGLKYRYFRTGKLNFNDEFAFSPVGTTCGACACSGGTAFFNSGGHFSSHSLLASLTYNFGAPAVAAAPVMAAPPPPPPAAPETQTCPDGSVILATSAARFRRLRRRRRRSSAANAAAKTAFPAQAPSGIAPRTKTVRFRPGRSSNCGAQATIERGIRAAIALAKPWPAA